MRSLDTGGLSRLVNQPAHSDIEKKKREMFVYATKLGTASSPRTIAEHNQTELITDRARS